jgi:hypothetical protein
MNSNSKLKLEIGKTVKIIDPILLVDENTKDF